ncbi:MAG: LVIVD repeat-containing protein, partial [Halobacteriaceae archaeon]
MKRRELMQLVTGSVISGVTINRRVSAKKPYSPYGSIQVPGAKEAVVGNNSRFVYVATTDGFTVIDVDNPSKPSIVAQRKNILSNRDKGPLSDIFDVKVSNNRLIVVGPANEQKSALQGAAIYDVSVPSSPTLVDFYPTDYPIHNAYIEDHLVFLTGNTDTGRQIYIIDISGKPTRIGSWSIEEYDSAWADVSLGLWTLHDVYVQNDMAFLAHWDAGTWILDISDPSNPSHIKHHNPYPPEQLAKLSDSETSREVFQLPGNSHYVAVSDDASLMAVGREAWDIEPSDDEKRGPGGIDLFDITGDQIVHHGTIEPPPTPDPSFDGVRTTAHNFDIEGERLYSAWYQGGIKIHNISDPSNPKEIAWWRRPDKASFWTAQKAGSCVVGSSWRSSADD